MSLTTNIIRRPKPHHSLMISVIDDNEIIAEFTYHINSEQTYLDWIDEDLNIIVLKQCIEIVEKNIGSYCRVNNL
jgi:hypothetical protein